MRSYCKHLDQEWPYWFFFLSRADESIQLLEISLCDTSEVRPRVAAIDLDQMERSLAYHFGAMHRLGADLNVPEEICKEVAEGIVSIIRSAGVEGIEGDEYR